MRIESGESFTGADLGFKLDASYLHISPEIEMPTFLSLTSLRFISMQMFNGNY